MPSDRTVSTIVLVDSADVAGSVGKPGFLNDHLKPMGDSDLNLDIVRLRPTRCDIVAQRITGVDGIDLGVPDGVKEWYATMTDPVEIPDTASLMVLSLSEAITSVVLRHKESGVLVQPPIDHRHLWTQDQIEWLDQSFEVAPPSTEAITDALQSIARALESSHADLVIFNTSTFIPGEKVYWFPKGDPETISVRSARVNLVIDTLLKELDITLVDVDRITAEMGAGLAVTGPGTYSDETLGVVGQEAIAMILDLEGISHLFASEAMQLSVPRYDRRTSMATLTRWHIAPGSEIVKGDALFDLRFGNLHSSLKNDGRQTDKAIDLSVVAGRAGHVDSISASAGAELPVGTRVGIVISNPETSFDDIDNAAMFPVGVRVEARDDG